MPYRIDIAQPPHNALDRLAELRALDIELTNNGLAALIPDGVTPDEVAHALDVEAVVVSRAIGRDNDSVWLLNPRAIRLGSTLVVPPGADAPPGAIRLIDSTAFGSGHHPTTVLCAEAIEEALAGATPDRILDVGTGSGILALVALAMGAPRAVGLDIDADALAVAAENARLNNVSDRLELVLGGPEAIDGAWPLVIANILAAPLIEMAPVLVRRVGHDGQLILSGIPRAVEREVSRTYERLGMRLIHSRTLTGWSAIVLRASW